MNSGGEGTAAGAIHAAFHVAAALVQRDRTGEGCFIDVSGTEGVIAQAWIAATYTLNEHRINDRRSMPAHRRRKDDRRQVPVLPVRRRQERPVLLHRTQVLAQLLPRRRAVPTCSRPSGGNSNEPGAGIDFGRRRGATCATSCRPIISTQDPRRVDGSWPPSTTSPSAPPTGPCSRRPTIPTCSYRETFHDRRTPASRPVHLRERGRTCGRPAIPDPPPRARARRAHPRDPAGARATATMRSTRLRGGRRRSERTKYNQLTPFGARSGGAIMFTLFSVDDHIVEPRNVWSDRVPAKFRDRAPHVVER